MKILEKEPGKPGLFVYAAMKTETEKAIMRWMEENQPDFVLNRVVSKISHLIERVVLTLEKLPNANFGAVLIPEHQGFPS